MTDYRALNRGHWDERAPAHADSPDYAVERFLEDPAFISGVVRFDLPLLGDVAGARGVHLQCHIGTDTLSLARLGARMSGVDFSAASLTEARRLAAATGTNIEYVQAEVYDAVAAFGEARFDLVYTGIGALCWLPDVDRWAAVVAQLLRPGGRLFMREGHPMLWALDDARKDGLLAVEYPYFQREEAMVFTEEGTYVQTDAAFEKKVPAKVQRDIETARAATSKEIADLQLMTASTTSDQLTVAFDAYAADETTGESALVVLRSDLGLPPPS